MEKDAIGPEGLPLYYISGLKKNSQNNTKRTWYSKGYVILRGSLTEVCLYLEAEESWEEVVAKTLKCQQVDSMLLFVVIRVIALPRPRDWWIT